MTSEAKSKRLPGGCPVCGSPTCNCGDACRCTEESHCSVASQVLHSLPSELSRADPITVPALPRVHQNKAGDLDIQGMSCASCSHSLQTALSKLAGVVDAQVDWQTGSATVQWEEPPASLLQITEQVESLGYHVQTARERVRSASPGTSTARSPTRPTTTAVAQQSEEQQARIAVSGMTCTMCSQAITGALQGLAGVTAVQVSLTTDTATVHYNPGVIPVTQIQQAIEDIGYQVEDVHIVQPALASNDSQGPAHQTETVEERWQRLLERQEQKVKARRNAFLWSLVGSLPILVVTMILPHVLSGGSFLDREIALYGGHKVSVEGLLLWILATPVQFLSGWDFYRSTFYNLRSGRAGMDVLVALGTTASYGYACGGLWSGDQMAAHFFETAATLICFVLAGKWMQAFAVRRTSRALTELMKLQSPTAVLISPTADATATTRTQDDFNPLEEAYREETVPIEQVLAGDLVKVIRGSAIPADGRIAFGEMSVDESMVTGESMPVLKTADSVVLGGTLCVETSGSGAVFCRVTGVGSETALFQIIELVQEAQTRSVPIQSFADSVSAVFVPTVCVVSLLTYMVWYALCSSGFVPAHWYEDIGEDAATFSLIFGIACLVISCPCALGLATPTAVMVGVAVGAKYGVLMKGGEALEVASKVDSVVLDKTGTLTKGQPVIVDYHRFGVSLDNEDLLWMLGSLEKNSEHPLALAVVRYAEARLGKDYLEEHPFVQPKSFRALTGRGASGVVTGQSTIAVGNRAFAVESGIEIPTAVEQYMQLLERDGKTAVFVAVEQSVCLVLGIADKLKADAAASIAFLRDVMKLDVWMVTGDNRATAGAIGRQLGLSADRVISEALPAVKVQQVRKLQAQDHIVAMVGDGINDSPALAQADVGISLGSGAKIATEASDIVLVRGNVAEVCLALDLSRAIFRRIQLNLLFSLLYNCLGIPIAAGVFYPLVHARLPPTVAGAAMALSSVSVVLSSLSLRLYQPPAVTRRRTSFAAWAREMERRGRQEDLQEPLLTNDHLGCSIATDATAVIDNRSSLPQVEDNTV
jgi:Cu+-exporting ATPase